jgi:hypothetical protein
LSNVPSSSLLKRNINSTFNHQVIKILVYLPELAVNEYEQGPAVPNDDGKPGKQNNILILYFSVYSELCKIPKYSKILTWILNIGQIL